MYISLWFVVANCLWLLWEIKHEIYILNEFKFGERKRKLYLSDGVEIGFTTLNFLEFFSSLE